MEQVECREKRARVGEQEIIARLISDGRTPWNEQHRAMLETLAEAELKKLLPSEERKNANLYKRGDSWIV